MQAAQIDEGVDQGVEVSDGLPVAEMRALNAQGDGLTVDAFAGGALAVGLPIGVAAAVELVADASADAGGHGGRAAPFGPVLVVDGTDGAQG